jgi:hypothetical protein
VLVAGIEEEGGVACCRDDLAGGIEIALAGKNRVGVHGVDLHRDALRPGAEGPFARNRDAGIEEQGAAGTRSGLGKFLGRHDAEGEAGIDQRRGQVVGQMDATLQECIRADRIDIGEACVDAGEDVAVEQVWRVDDVAGVPKLFGEDVDAGCQTQCVMEQQNFGHRIPPHPIAMTGGREVHTA